MTRRAHRSADLPSYVYHPSFDEKLAERTYAPGNLQEELDTYRDAYMPDEVTRDTTRRMHYAAHRMHQAKRPAELTRWRNRYLNLRDRVVLGNRKLIYRAVRRRAGSSNRSDDLIGDCHIVLIQAVAVFNPWMGIRFSTYAYTCLIRALARLAQKQAMDWNARSISFDALPDGEPGERFEPGPSAASEIRLDEYLRDDHPLLSFREKAIINQRFNLNEDRQGQTLELVGKTLGLSKERVRQVQASALEKLRKALSPESASIPGQE